MAWQDIVRVPLRVFINDLDGTNYPDTTLDKLLVVAASYVVQEVKLGTSYTVDLNNFTISPDPGADNVFINFIVLKAACMKNMWDFNAKAIADGVEAVCGPVRYKQNAGSLLLLALIQDGPCKMYQELARQNNFQNNTANIRAILSPFSHPDINTI